MVIILSGHIEYLRLDINFAWADIVPSFSIFSIFTKYLYHIYIPSTPTLSIYPNYLPYESTRPIYPLYLPQYLSTLYLLFTGWFPIADVSGGIAAVLAIVLLVAIVIVFVRRRHHGKNTTEARHSVDNRPGKLSHAANMGSNRSGQSMGSVLNKEAKVI